LLLLFSSLLLSQTLVPDINIDYKQMDSRKKNDINKLKEAMENYIYNNTFSNNDYDYDVPIKIQLYIESADESSAEVNYNCQAFFTNEGDQRYVIGGWRFPFSRGTNIFRSSLYDPIGSMIDFYGYVICATELDGIELNGGTSLFAMAQEIIEKANMSKYNSGWSTRQKMLNELSGNFRLRKARLLFNECFWNIDDELLKEAKISLEEGLKLLEERIYLKNKDKYTRIFIEHQTKNCEYFASTFQDTFFLPAFRSISPENREYFNKISNSF
ncbi:MAG: DUF4835 family protein, partial [Candidatus Marinimicrobia bacterium]|nr:DUF4835 family protein [Candidatus Neomarinimicrobiota bacterium]